MKEIESKFYVTDLDRIASRLEALGADIVHPRVFEQNWRYDTPERSMDAAHQLLRLRKSHTITLTYKSAPVDVDGTSQRIEYQTNLSDIEGMRNLLEALGYVVTERYEKYRTEYSLAGLIITLDEMPFGDFVEIEGEEVAAIQQAAADIGLDWDANITENYLLLFRRLGKVIPLEGAQLTFKEMSEQEVTPQGLGVRPADAF